jgi:hypothetical protein
VSKQEAQWTADGIPAQDGRTIVITGSNTGVGFEVAKVFAARGATVVLACRSQDRARQAMQRITAATPGARLDAITLDLGSLASVRAAAASLRDRHPRVDVLMNNAGVMWAPKGTTADGFETHLGVNHLGHFAFTGLVLDLLLPVDGARVVVLSSWCGRRPTPRWPAAATSGPAAGTSSRDPPDCTSPARAPLTSNSSTGSGRSPSASPRSATRSQPDPPARWPPHRAGGACMRHPRTAQPLPADRAGGGPAATERCTPARDLPVAAQRTGT